MLGVLDSVDVDFLKKEVLEFEQHNGDGAEENGGPENILEATGCDGGCGGQCWSGCKDTCAYLNK